MTDDREKSHLQKGDEKKRLATSIKIAENSQNIAIRTAPIISFSGKKKRFRLRISARSLLLPFLAIIIALLLMNIYFEKRITPKITSLAQAQAKAHLTEVINRTVGEMAEGGELDYNRMVRTIRDSTGEVIYLEVNTGMLAGAKSHLVERIRSSLEENKKFTLRVPMGSLTGWNLFSGMGFPVKVRLFPIESAEGEIYTVLEDCGINQTRHLIRVDVSVSMMVVLPGENVTVESEVSLPLGERVLVGDVPEIYLDTLGEG